MRKLLTFLTTLTAAVAVIVLFTACEQFLKDPEDFLSYWASEAFIKDHSIGAVDRPDGAGVPCVSSSVDLLPIMLTVHNPKGFSFVLPTVSESAGIVEFKELFVQPTVGTHYKLERTSSSRLKLTYTKDFLQKYEQGSGSLNPTITLKATDGRVFKKTYTFGIKSNTPPPEPEKIVIAKTKIDVDNPASYYVLCLKFRSNEMTRKIGATTVPVHKDIRKITINDSHYTLLYKEDNSDFKTPAGTFPIGSFIEHGNVEKLTPSSPDLPSGAWVLYFKTDIQVESSNPQTSYTITLSDEGGVVSDSVTAELKEKFEVKFDAKGGNPTPNTQYILKGDKVTKPPEPAKPGHIFGGWYKDADCSDGQKWNFTTDTVTGNMKLYAKWTEKKHTVTFSVADGEGTLEGSYSDGSLNYTKTSEYVGDEKKFENVPEGTQVSFFARPADGWKVKDWTLNGSPVSAYETYGTSITKNTIVTVEFEKVADIAGTNNFAWKLLKKAVEIADNNAVITINGTIVAEKYKDNWGEIVINGKSLTIKRADGAASAVLDASGHSRIFKVENGANLILENLTLKGGKATGGGDAGCGGAIFARDASEIKIENCIITGNEADTNGGGLNVEGTPTTITNCIFTGNTAKNGGGIYIIGASSYPVVTISGGTIGGTGTNEANKATGSDGNGGGIYVGDRCKVILQNNGSTGCTIKGNTAQLGGGVYAANKADVSMKGGTQIAVDNDVYLYSGSAILVYNALATAGTVARITVPKDDYKLSTKVLYGDAVGSEHAKFAVTPKGDEYWTVDSNGYLSR